MSPENEPKPYVEIFLLIVILFLVIALFSSCATNGYGCKGRAKEPTGTVGKRWKAM